MLYSTVIASVGHASTHSPQSVHSSAFTTAISLSFIEIASEGGLIEADGKFYCFDRISPRTEFTDQYYDCGYIWRGSYRYFAAYTSEQIDAVIKLLNYLCDTLNAPRQTPRDHLSYDPELYDFEGIIGHHHVRSDKSDIQPGFDWDRLVDECKLNLV